MRRSPRVLLAWAAALIVMLVTVRVVTGDLGSLHRRAHDLGPDVSVVLAARDLALGAIVAIGDLRTVRRPSTTIAADALHDPSAVVGRVIAVPLLRDDVVRARHLVVAADGVVPVGQRAVHVVIKDGFQPPVGSVVDVLATYDPSLVAGAGTGSPGEATVVAHGARVLTLASASHTDEATVGSDTATDTTGSGVTLLVTETEARAVAYAASIGELALALAPAQSACCSNPSP